MQFSRLLQLFLPELLVLVSLVEDAVQQPSHADPPPGTEGQLMLRGGTAEGTGNLYMYHGGRWGSVCDDGWDLGGARVACRALGFPGALQYSLQGHFGHAEFGKMLTMSTKVVMGF